MDQIRPQSPKAQIEDILTGAGVERFGFASLKRPLSLDVYRHWIEGELHGNMHYLKRHLKLKEDPSLYSPRISGAIVIPVPYFPASTAPRALPGSRISLYARQDDYHERLPKLLQPLVEKLQVAFPDEAFLFHTDSGPVLERDLGYQAGLGWFGKNSCLINTQIGSLFFLAEILTSLDFPKVEVLHPDRCGTCTRCIDACPTNAILPNRTLDARRCISYLTIELKEIPEESLRHQMQDWLFGCDICQTVCPWNNKAFGAAPMKNETTGVAVTRSGLLEDLRWLLSAPDHDIKEKLSATPLIRPKVKGLRRNAMIVIANRKLYELAEFVRPYTDDPFLGELATWCLAQLQDSENINS